MGNKSIEELEEELKRLKLENELRAEIDRQNRLSTVHPGRSNIINEFFWWCAGVDKELIRQCPTDYAKYVGIGGTILFTALMAMLSGGYALFSVFKDVRTAAIFGVFWGLLIFNLDRFIVNTMYSDGKATISWMELVSGLPRIIMAIFLGIVISTPLELKIFEDEIKVVIAEQVQERIAKYQEKDNVKIAELNAKKDSISNFRSELMSSPLQIEWTYGNNEAINNKISERNSKQKDWSQKQEEIDQKVRLRYQLNKKETHEDSIKANALSNSIWKLRKERDVLSREITKINSEIQSLSQSNQTEISKAKAQRDMELSRLENEVSSIQSEITEMKEKVKNDGYKDLIEKEYGGFQAKMSAFAKMKEDNDSTRWSSLFIMLLFVIIETAPTFFKMMMEDGPYDELKAERAELTHAQVVRNTSQMNDDVNTDLLISTEKNKKRLEAEITANDDIMERIALTQAELLKTSIELWRQEELKKIQENPKSYIVTNEG